MENFLGQLIYQSRQKHSLTQDEYGARFSVSGPAIFKFEKGFVRPSLELWLQMARDADLPERRAVVLWLKSKLPKDYQAYLELPSELADRKKKAGRSAGKGVDYSLIEDRDEMRRAAAKDKSLPKALGDMLDDDDLWQLTKPTGHEINLMREMFAPLGKGSVPAYREALRLVREFTHSF